MTKRTRVNARRRIRWVEDGLTYVNPTVYRRRLESLIRGIDKLKIKTSNVHDDQIMKELESKQDSILQSLNEAKILVNTIYLQDVKFRYNLKIQKRDIVRQKVRMARLESMEEETKITSPDVTDILDQLKGSCQENSVLDDTLFEELDISTTCFNVKIDDIDISIFDMLNQE